MNSNKSSRTYRIRAFFICSVLLLMLSLAGCASASRKEVSVQPVSAREYIRNGTILHCWCWSFSTIKQNLPSIAAAGFSAIQTSPINTCLVGEDGGLDLMGNGKWYYHYQPTDWKIGNYQLGTRQEFMEMCQEAEAYGIKVIVDVVPNHTTPQLDAVSPDLLAAVGGLEELYHENGFRTLANYADRYQCTTAKMGGLPDVNTENPLFQEYFINYLNDCIACGADGFRYDTAKHIGLPDDPLDAKADANNFWPLVTGRMTLETSSGVLSVANAEDLFIYGEVLQGTNTREADYAEYILVTASGYGKSLRQSLNSDQLMAKSVAAWRNGAGGENLVTWVESHDTYANEGESASMTDFQLRAGYAAITARKEGTPLFFNRPAGPEATQFPSGARIGDAGNDEYMHPEVVAVNQFRKAMNGLDESLYNIGDGLKTLVIEREGRGFVIINLSTESVDFNLPAELPRGTVRDRAHGVECAVRSGQLKGTVGPEQILVIY